MRSESAIYQAISSRSKIEGAGGSMKIFLSSCNKCYYRSEVILPLYPPLLPCPRGGAACGGGEGDLEGELSGKTSRRLGDVRKMRLSV